MKKLVMAMLAGCTALLVSAGPALAVDPAPEETGHVVKLPETASDHLAMARTYTEKAAAWRKEAAYHRDMLEAYKKAYPDFKGGARNPWAVKMEKHCTTIIKDVEKLATDADVSADYHRLRAMEIQGK